MWWKHQIHNYFDSQLFVELVPKDMWIIKCLLEEVNAGREMLVDFGWFENQ